METDQPIRIKDEDELMNSLVENVSALNEFVMNREKSSSFILKLYQSSYIDDQNLLYFGDIVWL